jgi:hypothetical protein
MTAAKSDQHNSPDDNRRLKDGLTRETPTTEEPETITLGGMTLRRMSDEEVEASFWRREAFIAQKLGIPFNLPEEADPIQTESDQHATSASTSNVTTCVGRSDSSAIDSEQAPKPDLTRDQLRSLLISFLDKLAESPPPASLPEPNPPSQERPRDDCSSESGVSERSTNPSSTSGPGASRPTFLNGVQFVTTKGDGPISWHFPGLGKT